MSPPHVGRPLRRVEDRPLLVGAGLYTDDVRVPGTLHVAFVRSPHAHARLARLDVAAARGAPGVVIGIDADTGQVSLTRCVWVDDAGVVVNPLLAEGQLHGAYAQGAGQALLEARVYDEDGQLLTGSLMDYAVPRLGDFPEPVLAATVTPSPLNPLGAKGLGEAGCIALPPAIVSAVLDALAPLGVTDLDMPLTSEKIWRATRCPAPRRLTTGAPCTTRRSPRPW